MSIFTDRRYLDIEKKVKDLINKETSLSELNVDSTRAIGDAIKDIVAKNLSNIVASYCKEYSSNFGQKAMGNVYFVDGEDNCYLIDIMTHNESATFSRPNVTSVKNLVKFYQNDAHLRKYFALLIIHYNKNLEIKVRKVQFAPTENLDWSCLTFSASGTAQIQIANSKKIKINRKLRRKQWMLQLCDELDEFYPREIAKIKERIKFFAQTRAFWQKWPD